MSIERHDAILIEILQEKNTISGFLQSVFGFLARRTDFYYEMKNKDDTMGFPYGFKEQLVLKIMKQFEINKSKSIEAVPQAVNEVEVIAEEIIDDTIDICQDTKMDLENNEIQHYRSSENNEDKKIEGDLIQNNEHIPNFQQNEYYNGAKLNNYCWSQTINDLEIHVLLPDDISSKDLKVLINSDSIEILNKKTNQYILSDKLYLKCKNNDAVWSISEKKLQINLDKVKSTWWHKLLEQEESINLTKMDCTRSIQELPQEDQAVIEKLKWDHHQKMLGLPTSDDIKNRDMLRAAWDAEGSPFKGQPFDPSIVKFD